MDPLPLPWYISSCTIVPSRSFQVLGSQGGETGIPSRAHSGLLRPSLLATILRSRYSLHGKIVDCLIWNPVFDAKGRLTRQPLEMICSFEEIWSTIRTFIQPAQAPQPTSRTSLSSADSGVLSQDSSVRSIGINLSIDASSTSSTERAPLPSQGYSSSPISLADFSLIAVSPH